MRPFAAALLLTAAPAAADTLLVGNKGENTLSFVDLATGRETRRVETGPAPHEIALSPDRREAAVVAYAGRTIEVFEVATARKVRTIDLGEGARPHGLVWIADGRLVAAAEGAGALAVVARDGTVSRVATGQEGSHMVAVSADAARAYVTNMKSGSVTVFDLKVMRKLRDVPAGKEPEGLALSRDGRRLWVADRAGDRLRVFDTADFRLLHEAPTAKTPIRVALSADGRSVYVSCLGAGAVEVFDEGGFARRPSIRVGGDPAFQQVTLLVSPDGRRLYAAETGIDRVAEIDLASGRVLGRLPAGKNGDGLAIAPGPPPPPSGGDE